MIKTKTIKLNGDDNNFNKQGIEFLESLDKEYKIFQSKIWRWKRKMRKYFSKIQRKYQR